MMNTEDPMLHQNKHPPIFPKEIIVPPFKSGAWKWMFPLAILLIFCVSAAWIYGWHAKAVTVSVVLLAVISHVFAWVLGIVGLVPIVGPLIVKVLSLSIIWLLNAVGYLVSFVAIRKRLFERRHYIQSFNGCTNYWHCGWFCYW